MNHIKKLVIVATAVIIIILSMQSVQANDVSSIYVYSQNWYNNSNWALAGESGRNLKTAGCLLFSYAHAIEWLTEIRRGDDLLRELITICNDPNGLRGHPQCSHGNRSDVYGLAYKNYIASQYGISSDYVVKSENSMEAYLNDGGVLILRGPTSEGGHLVTVVGFARSSNGTAFLHIIDAHPYSLRSAGVAYYDSSFSKWSSLYTQNGADYWLKCSDVVGNGNFSVWNGLRIQNRKAPTSLELDTTSTVLFLTDSTYQLNATIYPSDASNKINWSSSDTNVANVSSSGLVTLNGVGTTIITAESALDETVKAECFIEAKYNGTGSIQFTGIKYPYTYKSGGSFWWYEGSGTISSDVNLSSVTVRLYAPNGESQSARWSEINKKSITMQEMDSDPHYIPIKWINTQGNCYFEVTATDILGRTLSKGVIFQSASSGATSSNDSSGYVKSFTTDYNDPQYMDEVELKGTRYVRYKASYTWSESNQYAQNIGGHLATISSAEENEAIYSLVRKDNMYGAWIGAYRSGNEWKWVTDEPFTYTNWHTGDGEPNNQWGIENYVAMRITEGRWRDSAYNNDNWCYFIVEFEPQNVESILLSSSSVVYVDETFDVTATVLPTAARKKEVIFSTSDSTVVTIDSATGTATALAEGTCKIFATAQDESGIRGEYSVTVLPKPILPQSITIHPIVDSQNLCVGDTVVLSCTVYPFDTADKSVYFKTDNENVAYIEDYTNVLVCVSEGTCNIVAVSMADANVTDSSGIKVKISPYDSAVRKLMETPDYSLPDNLLVIEAEAFYGIPAVRVKLSENVSRIDDLAFGGSTTLEQIYIPRSTTSISNSAFIGVVTEKFAIVGHNDTEAQDYAERNQYTFISLDREPEISDWVLISAVPENAIIVNTKTQYAYREKSVASYSLWSDWGPWQNDAQTIVDSSLKQEETATKYRWWAAKCLSCGHNNPYHATNCKTCGNYLGNVDIAWISVFAFSDDKSGTQTLLGRSAGRYFDGEPYWDENTEVTAYRYRTRTLTFDWGDWSAWTDTPATASENREVLTRTMAQYIVN